MSNSSNTTELHKKLVCSIVGFLQTSITNNIIKDEDIEGVEVATQCIAQAFDLDLDDSKQIEHYKTKSSLLELFKQHFDTQAEELSATKKKELTDMEKAKAEKFKSIGNTKVAEKKYIEAIENYNQAIEIDGSNAVYYANRAAAYSQMENYEQAVKDAITSSKIDPTYSKAYSRLGHAYFCIKKYTEAKNAYEKAAELDPSNEAIKTALETVSKKVETVSDVEQTRAQFQSNPGSGAMPDLSSLMNNPALMNMASQFMSNPQMAQMAQQFLGRGAEGGDSSGNPLAGLMNNPQIAEMARRFMGNNNATQNPENQQ